MLASPMALAQDRQLDPIFQVTPISGQADASCFENTRDDRNIFVRGATSTAGQTIIGGLLGAALGNQIGGGSGKDIATGVGAAIGASAGAYNANRQRQARIRECQQFQSYSGQSGNPGYNTGYGGQANNQGGYQGNYQSAYQNTGQNTGQNGYNTSAAAGFTPAR